MGQVVFQHQNGKQQLMAEAAPLPDEVSSSWKSAFGKLFGDDREEKWAGQLFRVCNDMMIVCDQDLTILHHNRAFLTGLGYEEGSFVGFSLYDFFPESDLGDAETAFRGLATGQARGLRINATVLSRTDPRQLDIRVMRSRKTDGDFIFYLVARDETVRLAEQKEIVEAQAGNWIIDGLPIAMWRTDHKLRITEVAGSLWQVLNPRTESLIGGDLSDSTSPNLPQFLVGIDYCDTMAGLSLHADTEWNGEALEVTVEPFVNANGKVMGTLGMIRKSKQTLEQKNATHLMFPNMDPTEPIVPVVQKRGTRPIEIVAPADEVPEIERLRSKIRPRTLASTDIIRRTVEKPLSIKTEPVALAK